MGRKRQKVPQNIFGKRLLDIMPYQTTIPNLYDITQHRETYDDGYKKRYIYTHLYGKEITLPANEIQNICKYFKVSSDYLFGNDKDKEKKLSEITGLSEKAIERLAYMKQNSRLNQEVLNSISMWLEESLEFPFLCWDLYSLCINLAIERKQGRYIHGLTNDGDTAVSAYMLNENLRLMRDKMVEKMKGKTDYYTERVYLPVFSNQKTKENYEKKKGETLKRNPPF